MSFDIDFLILFLRIVFLALLYGFLAMLVIALRKDLRRSASPATQRSNGFGHLVVIESADIAVAVGQSVDLVPSTSIGRGPHNVLALNDTFVSANHAMLELRNKRWWISDSGSTNGTFVNRRQIYQPRLVEFGDVIEIGQVKFKLVR